MSDPRIPTDEDRKHYPNDAPRTGIPPVTAAEGQTDLANARRFIARFGNDVLYCHPWGRWLAWEGGRWKLDDDGGVQRRAKHVADDVWTDARRSDNAGALRHASKTASSRGVTAMLALAASDVPIQPDELDANPWLLNCANGTVDLRTSDHREHRREDRITKLCPVTYDASAESPLWERFQLDIAGGDETLVRFKQRLYGYCATGSVREQVMAVFHGTGSNGKSTDLEAVMGTIGTDYAGPAPRDLLMNRKGAAQHPTELADLFGKRLVVAMETEQNRTLAESLVKQLTGGDPLNARRMREDFWQFQPTHKLILCTNHKPRIRGTDHAIWRRLRLVPFAVLFEGDRKDKSMGERLRAERQGILAWIIRGAANWSQTGLQEPETITAATREYRSASDVIGRFIRDCCQLHDAMRIRFSQFYEHLERWCAETGETAPGKRAATEYLEQRGLKRSMNNGLWFIGLGVIERNDGTTE